MMEMKKCNKQQMMEMMEMMINYLLKRKLGRRTTADIKYIQLTVESSRVQYFECNKQTTEDMMMQVKEMKRRIAADSFTKLSSSNKKQK